MDRRNIEMVKKATTNYLSKSLKLPCTIAGSFCKGFIFDIL